MLEQEVLKRIENPPYVDEVLALNDCLAKNPELSGEEYESSKRIAELLKSHGIPVEYPYGGLDTAFRGIIRGKDENGPRVCIIAEYDALSGIGHGCGHCASGSLSVLAALTLHKLRDRFSGRVDIVGTPDEEVSGGKIKMVQNGCFDGYDYALMIHMNNMDASNSSFMAMEDVIVEFFGKASHAAATPWEGRNAFNAAQLFFHALDMMRQHVTPDVRIHGIIRNGGEAPNIVPEYVKCEVYLRADTAAQALDLYGWMNDCAKGASLSTRTDYRVRRLSPMLKEIAPNPAAEEKFAGLFAKYGRTVAAENEPMGSSDIGEVDTVIPVFHPMICVNEKLTLHTKEMAAEMTKDTAHRAILDGARIMAEFILETMEDKELLQEIRRQYTEYRKRYRTE